MADLPALQPEAANRRRLEFSEDSDVGFRVSVCLRDWFKGPKHLWNIFAWACCIRGALWLSKMGLNKSGSLFCV